MSSHKIWVEKYRPTTLDQYVFTDNQQRAAFTRMCTNQSIPHLLLHGSQGSGKTTIAQILISAMDLEDTDVLTINASDENSIDVMRDKIKTFATTWAMGSFKIVHLEEADYLSPNAQAFLRRFMEEYNEHVRFIMTCNYKHKILPAVVSRCQDFEFKAPAKDDVLEYVAQILIEEGVKVKLPVLDKYVSVGYPDIRKIVTLIQQHSADGILSDPSDIEGANDYKFQLIELLSTDDWQAIRNIACTNVAPEEWNDVYRFLYENLDKSPKFSDIGKWESGIIIIADHLYKHALVADPEINAAAMFIQLTHV